MVSGWLFDNYLQVPYPDPTPPDEEDREDDEDDE